MAFRYNSGWGAITCDVCDVIFCDGLSNDKYLLLRRINNLSSSDPDLCPNEDTCKDRDDLPRSLGKRFAQLELDKKI